MTEDEYRDKGWFEVEVVYYDSPREDCSGYYSDTFFYPTAKEAWYAAGHINRENEPKSAYVYLRSGKARRFTISTGDTVIISTYDYNRFQTVMRTWREIKVKSKKIGTDITYNVSFN